MSQLQNKTSTLIALGYGLIKHCSLHSSGAFIAFQLLWAKLNKSRKFNWHVASATFTSLTFPGVRTVLLFFSFQERKEKDIMSNHTFACRR